MAFIIIDGYNVIGIQHRDMESARQEFIDMIIDYKKRTEHEITIVFDGWKSGGARTGRNVTGGVTVLFSPIGEKADSLIKKTISVSSKEWIVVSSDREIQKHAWSSGSIPIDSDSFIEAVEKRTLRGEFEPIEDEHADFPRRGNPRQLSKKQKAIQRALSKL